MWMDLDLREFNDIDLQCLFIDTPFRNTVFTHPVYYCRIFIKGRRKGKWGGGEASIIGGE